MYKIRRIGGVGVVLLGVVAGCVAPAGDEQVAGVIQAAGNSGSTSVDPGFGALPGEEYNGRAILGDVLDGPPYSNVNPSQYFSVGLAGATRYGIPQTVKFAGGASLKSTGRDALGREITIGGADRRFNDLVLQTPGFKVLLKVVGGDANITHYSLDLLNGVATTRICDDAIPVAGVIQSTGVHVPAADRLTLSCSDGAEFKCAVFGYPAGSSPADPMWSVNEACRLMVTANYCAQPGGTNTRTGTAIEFVDNAGVYQVTPGMRLRSINASSWPPDVDEYFFEAAFRPGNSQAVCMARSRWPLITSNCVSALPDCPDAPVEDFIDQGGAVLFVASKFNQVRFDRWRLGDDVLVTGRGYYHPSDSTVRPPMPGYIHEGADGMLLRVPPTAVPESDLYRVSLYRYGANDYFVARSDIAAFHNPPFRWETEEGWVYKQDQGFLNALRLYRHTVTGNYVSSTQPPATMAAYDWAPEPDATRNLIGWMAPAP